MFNRILFFVYFILTFMTEKYELGIYAMSLCIFLELLDIENEIKKGD